MNVVKPALVSAAAVAGMLVVSAWAWPHTPPLMAVHFGIDGQPNRFGSRAEGLLLLPAIAAAIALTMAALPAIMPRNARLERSSLPYAAIWLATLGVLLILHVAMTLRATGAPVDVTKVALASVGVLFALIGNFLGKVRYNYAMGIRTPWTLSSEAVWDRTHRATAPWVMAGGVLLFVIAVAAMMTPIAGAILLPALLVLGIAPMLGGTVYSYVVSRRLEATGP